MVLGLNYVHWVQKQNSHVIFRNPYVVLHNKKIKKIKKLDSGQLSDLHLLHAEHNPLTLIQMKIMLIYFLQIQ